MNITLLDLIMLNEGQLSSSEAEILYEAISENTQLSHKWILLRQSYLRLLDDNLIRQTDDSDSDSAVVAGYIDRQLTPKEISEFEEKCWQENSLLLEVLDCYQASLEPQSTEVVSSGLTQRLMDLPSGSHQQTTGRNGFDPSHLNGNSQRIEKRKRERVPVKDEKSDTDTAPVPPPESKKESKVSRPFIEIVVEGTNPEKVKVEKGNPDNSLAKNGLPSPFVWWSTAVTVLVLASIYVIISIVNSEQKNRTADEDNKKINQQKSGSPREPNDRSTDDGEPKNKNDTINDSNDLFNDPGALTHKDSDKKFEQPDQPRNPIKDHPRPDANRIVDDTNKKTPDRQPNRPPGIDPNKDSSNGNEQLVQRYPEKTDLGWQAVRGLVTIKHNGESQWSSTREQTSFTNGSEFQVLPGCWAEAKTNGHSIFVIDGDSAVAIKSSRDGRQFAVNIKRGKTGFRDVEKGTTFDLNVGRTQLEIESMEDDSEFGIDYQDFQPRVFVRKGKMRINGEEAERGTQGTVQNTGLIYFAKLSSFNEVRWLSKSTSKANISIPVKALEKSLDIENDLKRMLSSKNESSRMFAVKSLLSIHSDEPAEFDRLISRCMNSRNEDWIRACVEWLMTRDVHDPVTRRAWRVASTFVSNNLQNSPNLIKWKYKLIKDGTAASTNELSAMYRLLNHQKLFARHFAFYCLSMKFGNKSGFELNLPAAEKRMRLNRWQAEIAEANSKLPK